MIGEVKNYAVSSLFDIFANVVYAVPRFQREYTWGKIQWEKLFDDILDNNPGYFFGSIICISQGPPLDFEWEIVDGQQRLITLSLLLSAIYQALKCREAYLDDVQKNDLTNLKWQLVLKKSERIRVIPQIQNNNRNDYRAVLSKIGVISPCDPPPHAGNRKIFHCF